MSAYLDQLNRVRRFLNRIQQQPTSPDAYVDDAYAFFQNAWHLKDWIKHDPALQTHAINTPEPRSDKPTRMTQRVENEIHDQKKCRYIWLCGEIANATKHLVQKQASLTGRQQLSVGDSMRTDASAASYSISYEVDGMPLLDVAQQAVAQWEELLKKYALPTA